MSINTILGKPLQDWLKPGDILPDEARALLASAEVRVVLHDLAECKVENKCG